MILLKLFTLIVLFCYFIPDSHEIPTAAILGALKKLGAVAKRKDVVGRMFDVADRISSNKFVKESSGDMMKEGKKKIKSNLVKVVGKGINGAFAKMTRKKKTDSKEDCDCDQDGEESDDGDEVDTDSRKKRSTDVPKSLVVSSNTQNSNNAKQPSIDDSEAGIVRQISYESNKGIGPFGEIQPPGFRYKESISKEHNRPAEPISGTSSSAFSYPFGLGPVLFQKCFTFPVPPGSPCFNLMKSFEKQGFCAKQIDAANFIGVGFDGRGYYSSESRKVSLIQRTCKKHSYFLDSQVPDNMNCFGIYDTLVESRVYDKVASYMSSLQEKASVSKSSSIFKATRFSLEASASGSSPFVSGSFNAKTEMSSSTQTDRKEKREREINMNSRNKVNQMIAVMTINIIMFEITLDEVTPNDLSLSFLKDYMSLPKSYYAVGGAQKYQDFVLRWGTHYIRSAKMGGQLLIRKTARKDQYMTSQEFASAAESEFKLITNSKVSVSVSMDMAVNALIASIKASMSSEFSSETKNEQSKKSSSSLKKSKETDQSSKFTHTVVEAQGGDPAVAEAVLDFYSPSFKDTFHNWVTSIADYAKPIEFTMKGIDELIDINVDSLFSGKPETSSMKCNGSSTGYYTDQVYVDNPDKNTTDTVDRTVKCQFTSIEKFREDFRRRHLSLEKAIAIYMQEGPFPVNNFDLEGGEPGCETAHVADMTDKAKLSYEELIKKPFYIVFQMPRYIPGVADAYDELRIQYVNEMWYSSERSKDTLDISTSCEFQKQNNKICVRGLIMTYLPAKNGLLKVTKEDYNNSESLIKAETTAWLKNKVIARVEFDENKMKMPCNIQWHNAYRLDTKKDVNCIHFTAATTGSIYVVFASIPSQVSTWYYIIISPSKIEFFSKGHLKQNVTDLGIGTLGDPDLYETYFVCVKEVMDIDGYNVVLRYGKADADTDRGVPKSSFQIHVGSSKPDLSYYSLGTGLDSVSFHDVRVVQENIAIQCLQNQKYLPKEHKCVEDCHELCKDGCSVGQNPARCNNCRGLYKMMNKNVDIRVCVDKCPIGYGVEPKESLECQKSVNGKPEGILLKTSCIFKSCFGGGYNKILQKPLAVGYHRLFQQCPDTKYGGNCATKEHRSVSCKQTCFLESDKDQSVTIHSEFGQLQWYSSDLGDPTIFDVMQDGCYSIKTKGASGGHCNGHLSDHGNGASILGNVQMKANDQLVMYIGLMGGNSSYDGGSGGGGATFVFLNDQLLMVAGGGGGCAGHDVYDKTNEVNKDGQTTKMKNNAGAIGKQRTRSKHYGITAAGSNGTGASINLKELQKHNADGTICIGGAGAGFKSSGNTSFITKKFCYHKGNDGLSYNQKFYGGKAIPINPGAHGGFGGGGSGGAVWSEIHKKWFGLAGGAGGYSGGSGATSIYQSGGGGGSYINEKLMKSLRSDSVDSDSHGLITIGKMKKDKYCKIT